MKIKPGDEIEFWQSGEWTMVYLNGELVKYGDHYHADEWLQEQVGVRVVEDDAGFSVPDGRNPIEDLAEVKASMDAAAERSAAAERKRAEARALLEEADQIEGKNA